MLRNRQLLVKGSPYLWNHSLKMRLWSLVNESEKKATACKMNDLISNTYFEQFLWVLSPFRREENFILEGYIGDPLPTRKKWCYRIWRGGGVGGRWTSFWEMGQEFVFFKYLDSYRDSTCKIVQCKIEKHKIFYKKIQNRLHEKENRSQFPFAWGVYFLLFKKIFRIVPPPSYRNWV